MSRVIAIRQGHPRAVIMAGLRGVPGSGGGPGAGVSSFNGRTGIVSLTGTDVTTALAYTPANAASLAAVAASGAYGDLLGKPFIPASPGDIGAATAAQGALADTAVQPAALAVQLDLKVDKVAGYGLSQENFTADEKAKLTDIAAGATANANTDSLTEGSTNLYHTAARVLATALSGLSLATGGAITSADTVLVAFGKLQKQITDLIATVSGKQDTLVSATNIKTINGNSLLGSGDLSIAGGGAVSSVNGRTGAVQVLVPIIIACSDESTALTAGTAKVTLRMPYAFNVTGVLASLTTAQTSGSILTVDINEGGASILSTKLTIDNTEKTSATAATAPVISDSAIAADAEITIDIDQVGDGTAKGLKVTLVGYQP